MAEHNRKISKSHDVFLSLPDTFEEWKSQVIAAAVRFPLMELPQEICTMVLEHALVKSEPIKVCSKLKLDLHDWYDRLLTTNPANPYDARLMTRSVWKIRQAMDGRSGRRASYLYKDEPLNLTLGLLRVSRQVACEAAEVFFGKNTFRFPLVHGLIVLECFLYTIGYHNIEHLRKVEVHVPMWQHGLKLSNLQALWIEDSAQKTKLAKIPTPPYDRLLGALRNCCIVLGKAGKLQQLTFLLAPEHRKAWMMTDEETTNDMKSNQRRCYEKRLMSEQETYKHLAMKLPELKVTLSILTCCCEPEDVANMWEVTAEPTGPKMRDLAPAIQKAKTYGWGWREEGPSHPSQCNMSW